MATTAFGRLGTRALLGAAAGCLLTVSAWGADATAAAPAGDPQQAVWTQKEFTFIYQGFTSKYSCDGLRDKVETALLQLGARKKDLKITEWGCTANYGRPDPFPGVRVKMSVLRPFGTTEDATHPVDAHWQVVNLKVGDFDQTLEGGQCELVEEIHSKIVPLFSTRNIDFKTNCIPHQESVAGASLKLEVLQPDKKDAKVAAAAPH